MPENGYHDSWGNGASAGAAPPDHLSDGQFALLEVAHVVRLLLRRAVLIVGVTVAIAGFIGIREKYFSVKWYRAQALITPVSPEATLASSIGEGGTTGAGGMNSLAEMFSFGGGSDNVAISERYIAIMNSYAFTIDLIDRYHLDRTVLQTAGRHDPRRSPWKMHKLITDRFRADYDYRSGNLALYYVDPRPALAKAVLGDYLALLRDKVRTEEVQSAAAAVDSLQQEIRKTSDALLQNQLYELMARQIQREKIAQVQADFAFKVIEPPVVPDSYYSPHARRNAITAAAIVFASMCLIVCAWNYILHAREQLAAIERAPHSPLPASTTVWTSPASSAEERSPPPSPPIRD